MCVSEATCERWNVQQSWATDKQQGRSGTQPAEMFVVYSPWQDVEGPNQQNLEGTLREETKENKGCWNIPPLAVAQPAVSSQTKLQLTNSKYILCIIMKYYTSHCTTVSLAAWAAFLFPVEQTALLLRHTEVGSASFE